MTTRSRPSLGRSFARTFVALGLTVTALGACTEDEPTTSPSSEPETTACTPTTETDAVPSGDGGDEGVTVRLGTHDSFAVSDGLFDAFTADTGIDVEVVPLGDAGQMVSQAVLTAGDPVVDVMYGIDTTLVCRGIEADLFASHRAEGREHVPDDLAAPGDDLLTPIDVGDVCLNYSKAAYPDPADAPENLEDIADERFVDAFVTENPETSSPGLAFLLATISHYGEDGWEAYWQRLRANGTKVTSGWTEAYEDEFGSGTGERSIVTSYASSPVADVVYSDPPRDTPAIGVVADACFRQVEYAGVMRGTDHRSAAAAVVDFLLSPTFQSDIPLNMFVEPARRDVALPEVFEANRTEITDPITMDPAAIEQGRDRWTERWTEIVVR